MDALTSMITNRNTSQLVHGNLIVLMQAGNDIYAITLMIKPEVQNINIIHKHMYFTIREIHKLMQQTSWTEHSQYEVADDMSVSQQGT
jgi:phosphoribosyl-dephospho-CoA transferase